MAVSQIKRDSEIMKRKAEKKLAKIGDGHGLYLLVTPQGGTYWRLKYYYAGKEKVLALGVYPGVEIAQARAERDKAKALLRGGKDPGELKRERKHAIRGLRRTLSRVSPESGSTRSDTTGAPATGTVCWTRSRKTSSPALGIGRFPLSRRPSYSPPCEKWRRGERSRVHSGSCRGVAPSLPTRSPLRGRGAMLRRI